MLGGSVGDHLLNDGPAYPFASVASVLQSGDVLVASLKSPISELGQPEPKRYPYRAPLPAIEALTLAGVDLVSLANNHANDYGPVALADTQTRLQQAGIASVGFGVNAQAARAPVILTHNGVRLAFLSYTDVPPEARSGFDTRSWIARENTPGIAWANPDDIAADVAQAATQADVVIALLHFGLEGRADILPAQRRAAYAAIDAGAALVLGTYSDRLQAVERYNNGLIVYSLGKFIYEGFASPENDTAIFTANLTANGVEDYNWVPVVLEEGLPRLAEAEEADRILNKIALLNH